ncbi:MAG: ATP-binding cassette domain-containing protein [Rubrivivax sp.]|nr:ATP-binding cassette domain-containing protein [Rubrivivax sp.]
MHVAVLARHAACSACPRGPAAPSPPPARLESISEGRLLIGGRDLTHAAPSERQVPMVFQSYALYPHMTVAQNLSFGMRMRGVPRERIAEKLDRAVQMLQLQPYLARRLAELSGGQAQRVAIGSALVLEPALFLFDEPLSNLDAELRQHMRLEIAALHRAVRTTMVYVTHDQVEAMTLADGIVVLRDGRIEQVGTPLALYERPANTFVAGFIGEGAMNLLPVQADGSQAVLRGGKCLPLPLAAGQRPPARLGVRPEHLEPADDGPFTLQVQTIERLGATAYLHGHCAGLPVCAEVREPGSIAPGQTLHLAARADRLHAFDAEGLRLSAA